MNRRLRVLIAPLVLLILFAEPARAEIPRGLIPIRFETLYTEPGSPWENGYAESFHSRLRDEFLATEVFESLVAARKLTATLEE